MRKIARLLAVTGLTAAFIATLSVVDLTAQEKTGKPRPPRGPREEMRGAGKRNHRKPFEDFLASLPEADRAAMKKLAEENPKEFYKAVFRRMEAERQKEVESLKKLRKAYFDAPEGAEKEAALAALRKRVETDIAKHERRSERRIKGMEEQLAHFQKRLEDAKAKHEDMKKRHNGIVEQVMKDCTDPAKDFPPPPPGKRHNPR